MALGRGDSSSHTLQHAKAAYGGRSRVEDAQAGDSSAAEAFFEPLQSIRELVCIEGYLC